MKTLLKALCVIAIAGSVIMPAYAADKTIKMGVMTWPGMKTIAIISQHVLEDAGFDVETTEFSNWGIAYAALSNGDVQILPSQLWYVAHPQWVRYMDRLEKISVVSFGLYQAIAVPKYVPIDSLTELNENADKFGGKIIGIEAGTGLMRHASEAMKAYELDDMDLVAGSTPAMTAALKSAVARKEWIAVTLWDPTWMFQKFDMKFLNDPKSVYAPPQAYSWIAHEGFSAKYPRAREALASVYVPIAENRNMMTAVQNGKTLEQAVQDWIKTNADLIERWEDF